MTGFVLQGHIYVVMPKFTCSLQIIHSSFIYFWHLSVIIYNVKKIIAERHFHICTLLIHNLPSKMKAAPKCVPRLCLGLPNIRRKIRLVGQFDVILKLPKCFQHSLTNGGLGYYFISSGELNRALFIFARREILRLNPPQSNG